jgi:hypothetical protein
VSSHLSPVVRCSIGAIESVHANQNVVIAAAHAIVADTKLNARFHSLRSSASEEAFLAKLEQYEKVALSCESAYAGFAANPVEGAHALIDAFEAVSNVLARELANAPE